MSNTTEREETQLPGRERAAAPRTAPPSLLDAITRRFGRRAWFAVAAAAVMLAFAIGGINPLYAFLGFLALVGATVLIPDVAAEPRASFGGAHDKPRKTKKENGTAAILEALPDPAIVLEGNGFVKQFNARAIHLFDGIKVGQHISAAIRSPEVLDAISRAPGGPPLTVRLVQRVPVERQLDVTIAPLSTSIQEASDLPLLLVLRDLTERERISQMRSDFIANASHELKTPLASLSGFIETLQGPAKEDSEARGRFLTIMARQAERMTRLINDLLSLSRVEMSAHLPPSGEVDMAETAGYVAATVEPIARESNMTVAIEGCDQPAWVRGERDELIQVLQNLIHNALKYGRDGGVVTIRLTRTSLPDRRTGAIAVAVVDDGPGIPAEHLPRLTERFYRVDVATSRERGGTGLGLAIVKHVVNKHRGRLTIESREGEGSIFTIILPECLSPEHGRTPSLDKRSPYQI